MSQETININLPLDAYAAPVLSVIYAIVIDTVCMVCGTGSMIWSSVRLSVCQSVCPIDRQQQRRAAGFPLSAPRAGDIDQ